jgi:hypothetical protein
MTPVNPLETDDFVSAFVWQCLRTGLMLEGLLANMLEELPEDAFPGEHNAEVMIEMLTGTIRPVAEAAGEGAVWDAIELLRDASEKVIADLRAALALRIAMDRGAQHG